MNRNELQAVLTDASGPFDYILNAFANKVLA
jgi:hypothetical protein